MNAIIYTTNTGSTEHYAKLLAQKTGLSAGFLWKQPISKTGPSCYNGACLWKGRRTMLYTTEEAAVICGFLNAHLAQAGVEVSVRKRNAAFQRGVIMGTLQPDDYRWAENVLCFLKPCWWQLHEDHRALENALLKTHLLAQR